MGNDQSFVKRCSKCGETKPVEMFPVNMEQMKEQDIYCNVCEIKFRGPFSKKIAKALASFEAAQEVKNSGKKQCRKCGETKSIEMFPVNGREKDGLNRSCTACIIAKFQVRSLTYYEKRDEAAARRKQQSDLKISMQKERELRRTRQAQRRAAAVAALQTEIETPRTPEQLAREAEIRQMAREERNKKALEYLHPKTPEMRAKKREEQREYSERTKEIMQQQAQERNEKRLTRISPEALSILEVYGLATPKLSKFSTPEEVQAYRKYRYQLRQARIKANGGTHTRAEIRALREAQKHQCAYCNRLVKLTEDHIIPLIQGGRDDIANICMACGPCNRQKNGRTPEQWIKRWYLEEQNRR